MSEEVQNEAEITAETVDETAGQIVETEPVALPDPLAEDTGQQTGGQKYRRGGRSQRMDALTWSGILVWAGVVMLADNLGFLTRLELRAAWTPWFLPFSAETWTVFFLGVGVILLAGVILRLLIPAFRHDVLGNAILTIIAFAIGLGRAELIWPLILIAVGVTVIMGKIR